MSSQGRALEFHREVEGIVASLEPQNDCLDSKTRLGSKKIRMNEEHRCHQIG